MSLRSLAPGLLLAAPRLGDPNFEKSVVVLGRHSDEGALGWVVNGEACGVVGELLVDSKLVSDLSKLPKAAAFDREARRGGPVTPNSGWMLYRKRGIDVQIPGEIPIGDDVAVTGDADAFRAVLSGAEPRDFYLLLGYAGWGPMQLEREVREGAWLPCELDEELLFDGSVSELWDRAYRRSIGVSPGAFVRSGGGSA
ncbi:MAG: YqgE/AlgH family protein [Myxococcales bacterium]|nr:YqgE/AlgH family protein [Myxococcales bacterium]